MKRPPKTFEYKEACKNMWDSLTEEERQLVYEIPNFDKDKFFQITGIQIWKEV